MALVGASTAWEECRIALGAAILNRHGVRVSGSDWTRLKPAPNMPDGLGSSATAWHATLDEAQDDLKGQGYGCSPINATEIPAVLNAILAKSTRLLFDHIKASCGKGDQDSLDAARDTLTAFLSGEGIKNVPRRPSSALEVRDWRWLGDDAYGEFAQMLDVQERFAKIGCVVPPEPGNTPLPGTTMAGGKPVFDLESRVRVTQAVDGLSLERGTPDKLAKVPQAEISYVDDRLADTRTFNVTSVIGIDLAAKSTQHIIPFAHFARRRVKDKDGVVSNDAKNNISQWGFGLVYGATLNSYDVIWATPLFTVDDFSDSRQASIRINWTPGFLQAIDAIPFERSRPLGRSRSLWASRASFRAATSSRPVRMRNSSRTATICGRAQTSLAISGHWSTRRSSRNSAQTSATSICSDFRDRAKSPGLRPASTIRSKAPTTLPCVTPTRAAATTRPLKETDQWKISLGIRY